VVLTVQPLGVEQIGAMKAGSVVIGFMQPHARHTEIALLPRAAHHELRDGARARISRAQSMDALSSQASIAGYKAVLIAANHLQKFLPMLTPPQAPSVHRRCWSLAPALQGLQAIATARRLGAVVEAYDVRSATREQVKSLGAKFVDTGVSADGQGGYARELTDEEKKRQQEVLDARIAAADVVSRQPQCRAGPAPKIISRAAVERMRPGAVIVDIAAVTAAATAS